jgi:deazaflavin-dependent oxidoreductase (nitroreductase family)
MTDEIAAQLVGWGRVVEIEARGRTSGRPVRVAVGFVEDKDEDGSLLVAAGSPDADWARNLEADPRCRLTLGTDSWDAVAKPVEGPEAAAAVASLILRYGTPAEGLGRGPVFRLRPIEPLPSTAT